MGSEEEGEDGRGVAKMKEEDGRGEEDELVLFHESKGHEKVICPKGTCVTHIL